MDSGNSGGSLQPSSGDDEYYDYLAAVDSAFMSGGPPPFNPQPNNNNFQRPPPTTTMSGQLDTSGPPPPLQNHAAAARNPKKRSRASRRAPTTVLTTDTANFRVMVQEFTGIPTPPPFISSPAMPKLDLFGTRSVVSSPPYLRRHFAQKVQPPPLPSFLVPSSSSSLLSANNVNNYQLPIGQSSSNLFSNIQNPILSSLLQSSNPKFPFSGVNLTGASDHSQQKVGVLDEQLRNLSGQGNNSLYHHRHHASSAMPSGLPNLTNSDQIGLQNDHNDSNAVNWRPGNRVVPTGDKEDDHDQIISLRSLNGGNYISSTSDFQGGKEPENADGAAARGGGVVESWICPSD